MTAFQLRNGLFQSLNLLFNKELWSVSAMRRKEHSNADSIMKTKQQQQQQKSTNVSLWPLEVAVFTAVYNTKQTEEN